MQWVSIQELLQNGQRVMKTIDEDFQAWEIHKHYSHRWAFNKLEVAFRQGLSCGPSGAAPSYAGDYIHRPVYNLYGMGIGATKFEYSESMYELMINNGVVPPGHFWCQWISGEQLSIDYEKINDVWVTRSVWAGEHESETNLTKFKSWERLENSYVPTLSNFVNLKSNDFDFINHKKVTHVNIETRDDYVIEFHFRLGNDPFDDLPVGTKVIPVWDNDEPPPGEWRGNLHEDMELYSASGHLSNVRKGYSIQYPN